MSTDHLVKAQTVTATIPVGTAPRGVAITPNGAYAYVANEEGNTVSVINTITNTVTATIPGFNSPFGVAVTPDGAHAYITNDVFNDGSVSVISTAMNTITATITGFNNPTAVAVTPNGAYAYVANSGGNSVSVISTATNTVMATISTYFGPNIFGGASAPHDVAITPKGAYVYVNKCRQRYSFGDKHSYEHNNWLI